MMDNDIVYWLALKEKRGIIPIHLLDFIMMKFKSMENFWNSSKNEMLDIGLDEQRADNLINYMNLIKLDIYDDVLNDIKKDKIKIIKYTDKEYPNILKLSKTRFNDPPTMLFRLGRKLKITKACAIVGTRKCSNYARNSTRNMSEQLARKGYTIISGLARGIDYQAHMGALNVEKGKTIAVLAWMKPLYPPEHKELIPKIKKNGSIISEKYFGNGIKYSFIERNRIISGLSNFVIAVESGSKGGTIRQVDFATAQKKPIYTLFPPRDAREDISKGFYLMLDKGVIPINDVSDIDFSIVEESNYVLSKLSGEDQTKKEKLLTSFKYVLSDKNIWTINKLLIGYNKEDALKKLIDKLPNNMIIKNIKLKNLSENVLYDDQNKLKYYLIEDIKFDEKMFKEYGRPNCPRCGYFNIMSRGKTWQCKKCGLYFKKRMRVIPQK